MIELRTLGALDLRSPDGGEIRAVLVQPKRLALLVYLAIAAPRGFHRRDTLLNVLWPELDQSRARAALRNALHFLRRELGGDVLVNRGDDEIAVDAGRLRCDVFDFDLALKERRYEDALRLYRGELLDGFFLSGVREFERWLDAERDRVRDRASGAAWALAQAAEAASDYATAAEWARRAAELDPFSERSLRRLLITLARIGDRAGAIHAYEAFAEMLRDTFDVAPSPETRAVADAIRSEMEAVVARPPAYRFAWADPPPVRVVPVGSGPTAEAFARQLAARRLQYRRTLAGRIEALSAAREALATGSAEAEQSVRRIAHTLRGSGAIYGFPEITEAAGDVEDAEPAALEARLGGLLACLRGVIARGECGRAVVLVVEDDDAVAADLAARLDTSSRDVVVARSAAEADGIVRSRDISLVILDLVLPDLDGRNLLVRLREDPATAALPVIVVSAKSGLQPRSECLALGADAYFEKPYDPEALAAAVSALLQPTGEERGADSAGPTVAPDRGAFCEALARACADPAARPVSVALVGADAPRPGPAPGRDGSVAGRFRLQSIAEGLSRVLGPGHTVAHWADDALAVILPASPAAAAAARLDAALGELERAPAVVRGTDGTAPSLRAGLMEVRPGHSPAEAVAEADYRLHVAAATERRVVATAQSRLEPPAVRVLLAEDDEFVASVVEDCLQRDGMELLHYAEGDRALSAALRKPLSLILLDVDLPGMSGFEILERLRRVPSLDRVPIAMLAPARAEEDIARGVRLGADDCILKPFSPSQLTTRVQRLLNRRETAAG